MAACSSISMRAAAALRPGAPVSEREFPKRDKWNPGATPLRRGSSPICGPADNGLDVFVDAAQLVMAGDPQRVAAQQRARQGTSTGSKRGEPPV